MPPRRPPLLTVVPPPVAFVAAFLLGIALNRLAPWQPSWMEAQAVRWVGWALIVAGLLLGPLNAGLFVFRGTTINPVGQPSRLVAGGAYSWTRNPMYVGLTLIYVGVALALGKVWPLTLVVLPWAAMNWAVIPFEEARLRDTFGQAYVDYCRRVRRWV